MKKLIIIMFLTTLFSCVDKKAIEAKVKYQAETGSRINNAQHDTDDLFNEMK